MINKRIGILTLLATVFFLTTTTLVSWGNVQSNSISQSKCLQFTGMPVATNKDFYFLSNQGSSDKKSEILRVSKDLSTFQLMNVSQLTPEVSKLIFPVYTTNNAKRALVLNAKVNPVKWQMQNGSVYVGKVKLYTPPAPYVTGSETIRVDVTQVYEIITKDSGSYYLIEKINNIPHINAGEYPLLLQTKNGKPTFQTEVYDELTYLGGGRFKSHWTHISAGIDEYVFHNAKTPSLKGGELVATKAKGLFPSTAELNDIMRIQTAGDKLFYGATLTDASKGMAGLYFFTLSNDDQKFIARPEIFKTATAVRNSLIWTSDNSIFAFDKNHRIIRNLTTGKSLYLSGTTKDLGTFSETNPIKLVSRKVPAATRQKQAVSLPVYTYINEQYICLEDMQRLGYLLKWNGKTRVVSLKYTGKSKGTSHQFKSKIVYDNDVVALIDGIAYNIYNAEGYSLVKLDDLIYSGHLDSAK